MRYNFIKLFSILIPLLIITSSCDNQMTDTLALADKNRKQCSLS